MNLVKESPLTQGDRTTLGSIAEKQLTQLQMAFFLVPHLDEKLIKDMVTAQAQPMMDVYCGLLCENGIKRVGWDSDIFRSQKLKTYHNVYEEAIGSLITVGQVNNFAYVNQDVDNIANVMKHADCTVDELTVLIEMRGRVLRKYYLEILQEKAPKILAKTDKKPLAEGVIQPTQPVVPPVAFKDDSHQVVRATPEPPIADETSTEEISTEETMAASASAGTAQTPASETQEAGKGTAKPTKKETITVPPAALPVGGISLIRGENP